MAYIHCHKCGWSQDDFYDEKGYNPFTFLNDNYKEDLFSPDIDKPINMDDGVKKTKRQMIAEELISFAERILGMKWITHQQFEDDPNKVCPKCGSAELDID